MTQVYVCIVEDATNEPSTVMGPMAERRAERVAGGASINLNHSDWHIDIIDEDELPEGWKEKAE
jgi:hypothetical protein